MKTLDQRQVPPSMLFLMPALPSCVLVSATLKHCHPLLYVPLISAAITYIAHYVPKETNWKPVWYVLQWPFLHRDGFWGPYKHLLWHSWVSGSRSPDRRFVHPGSRLVGARSAHLWDACWWGKTTFLCKDFTDQLWGRAGPNYVTWGVTSWEQLTTLHLRLRNNLIEESSLIIKPSLLFLGIWNHLSLCNIPRPAFPIFKPGHL